MKKISQNQNQNNSNLISLLAICIGYLIYSSMRRTLTVSLPLLLSDLQLTKSEIGIISSNFSISYGFSLIFSSLLCIAFTFGTTVQYLSIIWFLNGIIQGVGWPALASIIFENFDNSMRGIAWSVATSSGNLGYILAPFFFTYLLSFGWKGPFFGIAFCGIIFAVFCYFLISEKKISSEISTTKTEIISKSDDTKTNYEWLFNLQLWCLYISSGLTYFILKGISDWIGLYVVEHYHWTTSTSTILLFWSEVGGMIGSLSSGILSDLIFFQRRDITSFVFTLLMIPSFLLIQFSPYSKILNLDDNNNNNNNNNNLEIMIISFALFIIGIGSNGPKTLIGVSVRETVSQDIAGLAGGLLGIIGQIGGAAAGIIIGYLLQKFGWSIYIPMLIVSVIISSLSLLIYVMRFSDISLKKKKM